MGCWTVLKIFFRGRGKSVAASVLFFMEGERLTEFDEIDAIARVRRGDDVAFGNLYDRYARLVRCLCFDGTGNLNDAQEVFMKAYRQIDTLRDPHRFAYWLTGITRNAVRDWQRRHTRDRLRFVDTLPETASPDNSDTAAAELRAIIRRLPEQERMALHLFYLEEEPAAVARQIPGLSQSGFYKVLDRARRLVVEQLDEAEETTHD